MKARLLRSTESLETCLAKDLETCITDRDPECIILGEKIMHETYDFAIVRRAYKKGDRHNGAKIFPVFSALFLRTTS